MSNHRPRRSLLLGGAALALAPAVAFAASPISASPRRSSPPPTATARRWSLADAQGQGRGARDDESRLPLCRASTTTPSNMQAQQREAAAKGVVWLTVAVVRRRASRASSPPPQANDTDQEPQRRAGRRAARSAKPDRARLWRDGDAAHVHHRCRGRAGLQGRHRFDPVVERRRHRQGQAVCPRRARRGAGRQAGRPTPRPGPTAAR